MLLVLEPVLWRLVVIHICLRNPLPAQGVVGWFVWLVVCNIIRTISPFWSWRRSDDGSEAQSEEVSCFAQVDDVEDDPLVNVNVVNGKVEPKSAKQRKEDKYDICRVRRIFYDRGFVTCIWDCMCLAVWINHTRNRWWNQRGPNYLDIKSTILVKLPLTCLVDCIETQMALLCLAGMAWNTLSLKL